MENEDNAIKQNYSLSKQVQEELRLSEERYRLISAIMPCAFYTSITTEKGTDFFISENIKDILGYSSGEMAKDRSLWIDIIHPADRDSVLKKMRAYTVNMPPLDIESRLIVKDGSIKWIRLKGLLHLDESTGITRGNGIIEDITERKNIEEKLLKTQRLLEETQSITRIGGWQYDAVSRKVIWTDEVYRIFGVTGDYDPSDINQNLQFYTPESRQLARDCIKNVIKSGKPYDMKFELVRPDGKHVWIRSVNRPELENGKVVRISGNVMDITELKDTEEQIRILAGLTEISPAWITVHDLDGSFLYANQRTLESHGYTREEFFKLKLKDIDTPESARLIKSRVKDIFKTGEATLEVTHRRKDGSILPLQIFTKLTEWKGKKVILSVGIDITERQKAEKTLQESEEKYRKLFENANEGILIIQDRYPVFMNPMSAVTTGYSAEELKSKRFSDIVHPDDKKMIQERYTRRMRGEKVPSNYTFRIIHKSGETRWVNMNVVLLNWNGRPATLNFFTDVTDQKLLEEERQRVEKLESIGIMAGGIAHDFNNLLTAILGNISLVKMTTNLKGEPMDLLTEAENASMRAKGLTQQLLTFSRGGVPIKKSMSIADLLKEAASFALRGSNIRCQFYIPEDLWNVEIDEGQFNQVINNLVLNAQQAMPTGGSIEINAKNLSVGTKYNREDKHHLKTGNYVEIAIIDHGVGIPAEYLDKIYDPFFTTKQKGSGLGLSTTFSIIKNHDGYINVESEVGKGSAFTIYLPATRRKQKQKDKSIEQPVLYDGKVMIMDDEKSVREILGKMLKHLGYKHIAYAAEGKEALRLYKQAVDSGKPFSLVILDLTVPGGMGGKDTIEHLLKIDPGVRAIVSSGYSTERVLSNYKEYGFCGMVTKPYNLAQLRQVLQDIANQKINA